MSNTCPICSTPFAQGQACPNHPNVASTIINAAPAATIVGAPATIMNATPATAEDATPATILAATPATVAKPPAATLVGSPVSDTIDEDQGDNLSTVNDSSHFGSSRAGEYVLIEKLGEGGMGEVWLAVHPTIQKKVAVKILHSKFVSNKQVLSRFMQEAKAVNQIDHKNLVDIFTFGEMEDKRPYFVMEYLQGKSLAHYIKRRGVLPYGEILGIIGQICRALDAAHLAGVIHRDLKPDNLHLILADDTPPFVKILDFGIAKLTDTPEAQALTRTGMIFGTPAYMSPEQCEGAKKVDARSDQYSVAVILYEMLTGKNPFKDRGDSVAVILKKQIILDPPPPSSLSKGRHFPRGIDDVVLKALSKTPSQRFHSCNDLYEALAKAIADKEPEVSKEAETILDVEAKPNPLAQFQMTEKLKQIKLPEPPPKPPSSSKTLLIILLIASVVGGGVGLLIVSQLSKKTSPITSPAPKAPTPPN